MKITLDKVIRDARKNEEFEAYYQREQLINKIAKKEIKFIFPLSLILRKLNKYLDS